MSHLLNLHILYSFPTPLLSLFLVLWTLILERQNCLVFFKNLAYSCLATTVSDACQLEAAHTVSILFSSAGMKREKDSLGLDVTEQSPR